MHAVHGSSASLSSTSTSNGAQTPPNLPRKKRQKSRSNSFSSASVITIKRPTSVSSSSAGARTSAVPTHSDLPLLPARLSRDQVAKDFGRRRKSIAAGAADLEQAKFEGLQNLNRWSESTTSSTTSAGYTRRSRASSGAILPHVITQAASPHRRTRTIVDASPPASPQQHQDRSRPSSHQQLSLDSQERLQSRPSHPALSSSVVALPPLHTTPALSHAYDTESPSTIQTIATPSTQSSYGTEFFGDDTASLRGTAMSKRPVMIRNHTTPMPVLNSSRVPASESVKEAARRHRNSDSIGSAGGSKDTPPRYRFSESQESSDKSGSGRSRSRQRRSYARERTEKEKKGMLSKALSKANTAVLLDNAQNFEGALDAYGDACKLLLQVMDRSSGLEDKRKLEAIRVTYTNRIEELRLLSAAEPVAEDGKSLPARPMSDDSFAVSDIAATASPIDAAVRDSMSIEAASSSRSSDVPRLSHLKRDRDSFYTRTIQAVEASSRRDFETQGPSIADLEEDQTPVPTQTTFQHSAAQSERARNDDHDDGMSAPPLGPLHLQPPQDQNDIPAPLSPRRPLSPQLKPEAEQAWAGASEDTLPHSAPDAATELANGDASGSWLDTIDESASSHASSVHSVSSQRGLRRKHLRSASDQTDAEFDAAFDAAVEAAYDEGLEPDMDGGPKRFIPTSETAFKSPVVLPAVAQHSTSRPFDLALEDEEEERLLDEITMDYAQTFNFDMSTKSALPRRSDSSSQSRSTWQPSEHTTAATSLSTVNEDTLPPQMSPIRSAAPSINSMLLENLPPSAPPPQTSLPRPPKLGQKRSSNVRSRRLSGQVATQLKIETATRPDGRKRASTFHQSGSPLAEEDPRLLDAEANFGANLEEYDSNMRHEHFLASPPSLDLRLAVAETLRPATATAATAAADQDASLDDQPGELPTHRPNMFRKNKSSISLREHTLLLSPEEDSGPSAQTPFSASYMTFRHKRIIDGPLTSQRGTFAQFGASAFDGAYGEGANLFDTSLSSTILPSSPRSPGPSDSPTGLEPCPESYLLRPFWLMRALSSTLTHPRGGYLTTKLFVQREVWQTKGVKLKSVEDKIANCDLLTAALGRLAGVDTYDADAVMEELQSFEEVMERVQTAFSKKLGSDVGVGGLAGLFKDAAAATAVNSGATSGTTATTGASSSFGSSAIDSTTTTSAEKTKSKEHKGGYLSSWRKLRSKSSGAPLGSSSNSPLTFSRADATKDLSVMPSVPMTSFVPVERRGMHKRDVKNLVFMGPNREYMGSLARLFDGVQVLDQIARQVEDPGLKGTSPTHVGLELSIRHAAEFFAFYVCRFVLADLGILIDKFVKRATEWVLL